MKRYSVKVVGFKKRVLLEADYGKVENGTLVFRLNRVGYNSYPETVRIFAAGMWIDMYVVTE